VYNRVPICGCKCGTAVGKRGMLSKYRRVKHTPWQLDMRYCTLCACRYSKENGGRADKDQVFAEQRLVEMGAPCDGICRSCSRWRGWKMSFRTCEGGLQIWFEIL